MNSALMVMWDRQIRLYIRNRRRLVVTLTQPMLFLIAFGYGIGGMFEKSGKGNYIQFLIPGIVCMTLLTNSTMNGMSLIWDKQFGFLKETLVAPVSRTALLFGRCLGGATTSLAQALIILLFGLLMGFRVTDWTLFPLSLLCMFSIALLFNLLGTAIAAKFDDMHSFPMIINILIMPMVFLSGALYPVDNFPAALRVVMEVNPFTYCSNLLKYTLGVAVDFNIYASLGYLGGLIVVLGVVGTYFFNRLET